MVARFLASGFVEAGSANVSHPFDNIVIGVVQFRFEDFQIADFEAAGSEWDLKRNSGGY